jgi:hypothetical protein
LARPDRDRSRLLTLQEICIAAQSILHHRRHLEELLRRLQEYAQAFPPLSCKGIRFVVDGPIDVYDPVVLRGWSATAYGYSRWQSDEPLFLIVAQEAKASCRVRMRSLDPRIHGWLDATLDWLAPDWTTNAAQPLPAMPLPQRTAPVPLADPEPSAPPKRRRGPKPGKTPDEMEAICIRWLEKEQHIKPMWLFCDEHRITEYQLKRALREREKRMKGQQSS